MWRDEARRGDGENLVTEGSLGQGLVDGSLMGGGSIPNITN